MAPVYSPLLQSRQAILPPRPEKGPPGGVRVVNAFVGFKPFVLIFVASFGIFIVAVLCWKFGAFLRSFSRHKVIGGGKEADILYAKTWYGWTPLDKYQNRQRRRREFFKSIRDFAAWRTCHTDYSWVWWDPGGKKYEKRVRDQRRLRWIPPSLLKYAFDPADTLRDTSNNHPKNLQSTKVINSAVRQEPHLNGRQIEFAEGPALPVVKKRAKRQAKPRVSHIPSSLSNNTNKRPPLKPDIAVRSMEESTTTEQGAVPTKLHSLSDCASPIKRRGSLPHVVFKCTLKQDLSVSLVQRCASDGQQRKKLNSKLRFQPNQPTVSPGRSTLSIDCSEDATPATRSEKPLSWRYKAWGARMQRTTFPNTPVDLRGLAGRPGSPLPDTLRSLISTTDSECYRSTAEYLRQHAASDSSLASTYARPGHLIVPPAQNRHVLPSDRKKAYMLRRAGDCLRTRSSLHYSHELQRSHSDQIIQEPGPSVWVRGNSKNPECARPISQRRISNPEVRLIDDLERKLEWLSGEMEPGRKPYNFSILHNHWLNRATWVVYDPVSRVSSTERRLYGDPRFNYPFPTAKSESRKAKYPVVQREKSKIPKIDSWRLAVNGARKSTGVREFLKAVELFEGSADEPPDGAIDTATWILRKPPQGFEMSTKQKNAYFEGCGGWCEKLEYWQNVPRAYRARRVICEGRVNRRRMAEVAKTMTGHCKRTASKVTPHLLRHRNHKGTTKDTGRVSKLTWHLPLRYQPQKKKAVLSIHGAGLVDCLQPSLSHTTATRYLQHSNANSVHLFLRNRPGHFLQDSSVQTEQRDTI